MSQSITTTNHDLIKRWAEERDGKPAKVKGTSILRINFPAGNEDSLEDVTWEEFFEEFEDKKLTFLYQENTSDGHESRFFKFLQRK